MAELLSTFIQYVPRALGALAIVLVGLLLAVLAKRGATYLLGRFGFDELCRRVGITRLLGENARRTPTGFVGQLVFYAVVLFSVLAALGPLGLDWAYGFDRRSYIDPNNRALGTRPDPRWQLHFRLGQMMF